VSGPAFLNPAGGLRYHLRALRHGRVLWQPFRWALGEWLLGWAPPEPTLVVVGPSGGYCVQPFLFERFERVICLEPDPVARFVFQRRLARAPLERRPKLEFVREDRLLEQPEAFGSWLSAQGPLALLFSNFVGQLPVLLGVQDPEAPPLRRVLEAVQHALAGRSWASFHDRVSGTTRPEFEQPLIANSRLGDDEVLEALYSESARSTSLERAELLDHLTLDFFPAELPHAYFSWELEPRVFHLIEGVCAPAPALAKSLLATAPE